MCGCILSIRVGQLQRSLRLSSLVLSIIGIPGQDEYGMEHLFGNGHKVTSALAGEWRSLK
jgi:hypothetical protein